MASALATLDLGLTPKQLAWCQAYLAHGNAKQASIDAGYRLLDAHDVASKMRRHRLVRAYLSLHDDKGALASKRIRRKLEAALWRNDQAAHEGRPITDKNGSIVGVAKDIAGSNRALELIGKLHGAFMDRIEHSGQVSLAALVVEAYSASQPPNFVDGGQLQVENESQSRARDGTEQVATLPPHTPE